MLEEYHSLLFVYASFLNQTVYIIQVPSFFIRKLITQVFSFINISLFNRQEFITLQLAISFNLKSFHSLKKWCAEWKSLFGSLLLRRECCTFSNGEYVKSGLAELEKWIVNAKEEVKKFSLGTFSLISNLKFTCLYFVPCSLQEPLGMSSTILGKLLVFWYKA